MVTQNKYSLLEIRKMLFNISEMLFEIDMTNVSGWLPVPGKQMSYNKKAVRACMPTQLEQERGAGGGALLFPISALSWLLARA